MSGTGAELREGTELAGFTIVGELGRGGMGVVYLAEQTSLGRRVALKVITPALAGDPQFRERFHREAHHAASIEHPNVIPVFQAGTHEDHVFLAMRYVDGEDLGAVLRRDGPLDPPHAARVVEQVGTALDAAHAKGLIHRDVKPANVLLDGGDPDGHAYLTDFGLTKEQAAASGLTNTGAWVGTVDYAAPEQIDGRPLDARADVYSLACVFYETLTASVPFEGTATNKMWAHMSTPPPSLAERRAEHAEVFDPILARGMAKDPDERFPSAGDLGRAASAAASGAQVRVPEQSVATGLAAVPAADDAAPETRAARTRAARTRAAGEPSLSGRPTREVPPQPPTERRERAAAPGGSRRAFAFAAVIAAVAAGIGAAALLVSQLGDGDGGGVPVVTPGEPAGGGGEEPDGGGGGGGTTTPDAEPAGPAPETFVSYRAGQPGFEYRAKFPSGNGWSAPTETLEGEGQRLRTALSGRRGIFLYVDYTPSVVPDPGASGDLQGQVPHPEFGSATEYTIASSDVIPGCTAANPCVDLVVDDGEGGGWGVLAGGRDQEVVRDAAVEVAASIRN